MPTVEPAASVAVTFAGAERLTVYTLGKLLTLTLPVTGREALVI
jgi:hypothetical protein